MSELVYLSQPSRLGGAGKEQYRSEVIKALLDEGINTIHPFEAFPYERFEGHPSVGRELAMRYCCELIDACRGGVALTGISEGTLIEATYIMEKHPGRAIVFYPEFDPLWSEQIEQFKDNPRFTRIIAKLLS